MINLRQNNVNRMVKLHELADEGVVTRDFAGSATTALSQEWSAMLPQEVLTVQQLVREWEEHRACS